jgi:hypothetical protein
MPMFTLRVRGGVRVRVEYVSVFSSVSMFSTDMDMQHVLYIDLQHGHGHEACTWRCSMDMEMQHEHEHAAWTWTCNIDMDLQHAHVYAAGPFPW